MHNRDMHVLDREDIVLDREDIVLDREEGLLVLGLLGVLVLGLLDLLFLVLVFNEFGKNGKTGFGKREFGSGHL